MLCYGMGTIGRDMLYTMVSMFIMVYITEVLIVPDATLALLTTVLMGLRVFDAFNDPIMGLIVDNTRTRFGKFKPGMLLGALVGAICMILMFTDMGLLDAAADAANAGAAHAVIVNSSIAYTVVFGVCYVLWDIFYGLNDIAYWSMLPALSTDQKERERIGSFTRICANIGLFVLVVGIIPITNAMGVAAQSYVNPATNELVATAEGMKQGWFNFALIIAALMIGFQAITLIGVKERKGFFKEEESTSLLEMFRVIVKNDQLLWVAVSLSLFMIGYMTTTNFGVHFFKYAYGDENMYAIFAGVLGVSQLAALSVFTVFSKRFSRRKLYTAATILVVAGYILFFFAPIDMRSIGVAVDISVGNVFFFIPMDMILIGAAGVLIFVGEAFMQMLMLMFLTDTIEYGQLKLGKRNESITFSVQPFINKIGGAIATGVLGLTLIISGINNAETAEDVSAGGITIMKVSMLLVPLAAIVAGYIINMRKFKIDEEKHAQILAELRARGDIAEVV